MNPPRSEPPDPFTLDEITLLNHVIAAPNQKVAAEWLGCSTKHIRYQLKELRERLGVENNPQLFVLASISGSIDPSKVLPFSLPSKVPAKRSNSN